MKTSNEQSQTPTAAESATPHTGASPTQPIRTLLAQRLPFWMNLSEVEQREIAIHTRFAHFSGGQNVRNPHIPLGVILVLSGNLRAYMFSDTGKQITLFRIGTQESCVLAASCALSMITFDVFLDATDDADLLIIDADYFAQLLESNVYVEAFTYRQTTERFSEVMWVMEQVLFMSFDARLAVFLLDEVARTGSEELSLTHDEIAHHLGSAREVVSRMLKRFAEDGLVTLSRGALTVIDKAGLRALVSA